jgi:PQQ-dependent catabolism-associated CXXCW motif protein
MNFAAFVVAALAAASPSLALAAGVPEPDGYRMDDYRAPVPDTVAGGSVIGTDALKAAIDNGGVVLVDVLPAPRRPDGMRPDVPWMPLPRRDIPGSLWLPGVGRGAIEPATEKWFRAELERATGGDKTRPIVFYCLENCWMSWNATKRAASFGYTSVAWYPDGTDGWAAAGLPLAETAPRPAP